MGEDVNPAAFPCVGYGPAGDSYMQEGMTLRDWFAGQALSAVPDSTKWAAPDSIEEVARRMYAIADAMLAARQSHNARKGEE